MKRTLITPDLACYPARLLPLLEGATLYDSSSSPEARVLYVARDGGCFLKSAPAGSLQKEAALTRYFHTKGLAAEVLAYFTEEGHDWLLTSRVAGEDCTHASLLADPVWLCDRLAVLLRELHELPYDGCPVQDRNADYVATAARNYQNGAYDTSLFPDNWGYRSAAEAWSVVEASRNALGNPVLLHGDYCLPNVMFEGRRFSGLIDLGNGGVGDRHIDLFWGAWSLFFNLKTDAYRERFLDAYGRDVIDADMFRVIAAFEVFG